MDKNKLRKHARWNVNKTIIKVFTVRNKIKHRKKYKIGKSSTPLGKISIVLKLGKPRKRTIEILPSGVCDFPILYFPGVRLYIANALLNI